MASATNASQNEAKLAYITLNGQTPCPAFAPGYGEARLALVFKLLKAFLIADNPLT